MNEPKTYRGKALSVLLFVFAISSSSASFADNALHKAIIKGKEKKALRLIEKDKGIEELADNGFTPLLLAVNRDQVAVISALIEKGVSLETRIGPSRFTALHSAVIGGSVGAVNSLVKAGANIEAVDANGATPWMTALRRNSPEIAIKILDAAEQPLSTESFEAAIRMTSENGSVDILDQLLPDLVGYRPDLFQSDHLGYAQIHHLARAGRIDSVIEILEAGINVDLQVRDGAGGDKGVTPLWVALRNDHDALADMLIQRGADPTLEGEERSSPLRLRLQNGNVELIDAMIAKSSRLRRSEFRDLESLANFISSTLEPISMNALITECGSAYQPLEAISSSSVEYYAGGLENAYKAASGNYNITSIKRTRGLNVRTAVKVRSTDPVVGVAIRSQISANERFCQIFHVDGTYSASSGITDGSRLLSVLVNPNRHRSPIPFDAVIAYEDGVARHYYQSNGQWFEIRVE